MKQYIKKLSILIIVIMSLSIFNITKVNALNKTSDDISVYEEEVSFNIGELSFKKLNFKDNSEKESQTFGLAGIINNTSKHKVYYHITIDYYDYAGYHMITTYGTGVALPGNNKFTQMTSVSELSGADRIIDITDYKLLIFTSEKESTIYTPSNFSQYQSYNFVIDKYDISMIVNQDNTFDITETITAYFNIPQHGIYRNIPRRNTINRLDGTTSNNYAKITNISVDNKYTKTNNFDILNLKIGDENQTLTGVHTYTIKYKYNIGKDPLKDADELYFNLIGPEWDTVIGNVTFTVTMPSDFDSNLLGFSSGEVGSTANDKITYTVNNNIITGKYNGILNAHEALTIRTELPEGYFTVPSYQPTIWTYLLFVIPMTCLIISIILWYKHGKDEKVIETVEFYPPNNLNSLEIGYLYKGYATNKDVTSLLIYLANKGYLKIIETTEKSLFNKNNFQIIKVKNYDGKNDFERLFFKGIFKNSKMINGQEVVTNKDLYNKFYRTMNKILNAINSKKNHSVYKEQKKHTIPIGIMIILTLLSILTIPTFEYGTSYEEFALTCTLVALYTPFYYFGLFGQNGKSNIFVLIFVIFHSAVFFFTLPVTRIITTEPVILFEFIIGLITIISMIIIAKLMPNRTKYGTKMLGLIRGFKNFLETAEKEQLEDMVMKEPTYFYDILPYTYVLGISKKWIKKFESINLAAPTWYTSPNGFSVSNFNSFIGNTMSSTNRSMSSSPNSGSGGSSGGSSGGGSSGGGSGGGGGGSW